MPATRREFLKGTAAATVALLAPRILRGERAVPAKMLVILQLAGGNDSLNTVVPYTDARYRKLRLTLALEESELLPAADGSAFHPSLGPMITLFGERHVAIIDGVGFPSIDRSHFRSQDVWQTADEACGRDHRRRLGWIGRYADHYLAHESPLVTIALGNRAPLGMAVDVRRPTVISEVSQFAWPPDLHGNETAAALRDLYAMRRSDDPLTEAIRAYGDDLFRAVDAIERTPARASSIVYPQTSLGQELRSVASLIDTHPETQVVWVTTGSYDTHAKQAHEHAGLLSDLASSVAAFQSDLDARGLADRVLLLAWSEFGRRAAENASGGTDHGKAGIVFVIGKGVQGGLWGEPPDLARLEDGDIPCRVDFRRIYATIIRRWFGRDPEPVLRGAYAPLGFLGS